MNPERWQEIKELFDQARTLPPNKQAAFLDSSCADDSSLRKEVERLLKSYESGFLEEPLLPEVADIVGAASGFQPGKVIGRYRIGDLIGTGGMGEVFLADDTELDRPVAIKVLHHDVAEDDERVRRFIQEARAASALNHPNILTIYEIGSFEGARFIVSEYVDGETLRERMAAGLTAAESLEITCQIAAALQAAHSAGIVHRDIKPENIMLRKDGLVKVLDFGLAKLTEADDQPVDANASPLSRLQTSPGLIMGTVAYMSPEQASGKTVDSRTDLWSLGVVFHEMLTGESPFKGESVTDLVTSILKHEPASLDLTEISQELQPICKKALAKDQKARYQTAQGLLTDLQGEKKRMEYATQPTPFITVSSTDELKTQLIRPRPTLSAEYIVTGIKRHKYATLLSLAIVAFMAVGLSVYKYNGAPMSNSVSADGGIINESTTEKDLKMSRVAASGNVSDIAISPDGKFLAYTTGETRRASIHVKELASQRDIEIVPASKVDKSSLNNLVFTPDGLHLLYQYGTPYNEEMFRVPVAGGTPVKIADNTNSLTISPDGKFMALHKDLDVNGKDWKGFDLLVSNIDGRDERILKHTLEGKDDLVECPIPVWSPDGKWLACSFRTGNYNEGYAQMYTINVADGTTSLMSDQKWVKITGVVWMPDNSLVVAGQESAAEKSQLWLVTKSSAKRITNDVNGYTALTATRDGMTLVTVQGSVRNDLWIMPNNDEARAVQVTSSGELCGPGIYPFSSDKVVICSTISGRGQVWMLDRNGTERRQMTFDEAQNGGPVVTPDGRFIVYNSVRADGFYVYRMNADGTDQRQLTPGNGAIIRTSSDSKWVYYWVPKQEEDGRPVYKISIDGGPPILLAKTRGWAVPLDVSPRDERIAELITNDVFQPTSINIYKPNGRLQTTIPVPLTVSRSPGSLRWTPDGRSVAFVDDHKGTGNIWVVKADGKTRAKPLTNLTSPPVFGFRWSPDGKELFFSRQTTTSDAIMITNPRE